jgi:phosphoesterase RecJ-like protein
MNDLREAFQQAAGWLSRHPRLLLLSHTKPDGDAIGSLVGLQQLLQSNGHEATAALYENCPPRYASLSETPFSIVDALTVEMLCAYDGVIIVDTCTWVQIEPAADALQQTAPPILAIDHHVTRDEIGEVRIIDTHAPAACAILAEWARFSNWTVDRIAARALFAGLATDSGWFRFPSVTHETFELASWLIQQGAAPSAIYEDLFLHEPAERIKLLGELLSDLQLHSEGQLAMAALTRDAFGRTGATPAMTEDLINEPLRIHTVNVMALLVEQEDGVIRVSLRSKRDVDVAKIAASFGGGGHERAAGLRMKGTLADAKAALLAALERALAESG